MSKKIGAFVGKFYPPHIGHLWVVDTLIEKLDEIYIIISTNQIRNKQISEISGFKNLDAEIIKGWLKQHYKNNPKIKVEIFDETGLKPYPEDRDKWAEKFKKQFPDVNVKIADESYREFNRQYFPNYDFLAIPRNVIDIHSTEIRNNLKDNLKYIIPEGQEYFKNLGENNEL